MIRLTIVIVVDRRRLLGVFGDSRGLFRDHHQQLGTSRRLMGDHIDLDRLGRHWTNNDEECNNRYAIFSCVYKSLQCQGELLLQ